MKEYRAFAFGLALVAALAVSGCSKGSGMSPDPSPAPGPADGMVTFTWTPPAGTDCSRTGNPKYWSAHRATFNAKSWLAGYEQAASGLFMQPVGVDANGAGGYWTVTVKVPTSVQFDGVITAWDLEVVDDCINNGVVTGVGISAQGQGCSGGPVKLADVIGDATSLKYGPPCQITP